MANIVVLGNCSIQTADRETTSFVCDFDGTRVLIDAGPGVVRQLNRAGMLANDIDVIVLTHGHGDHSAGFPYLMFMIATERLLGRVGADAKPIVHLVCTEEVQAGVMAAFKFMFPPGRYPQFELVPHLVADDRADQVVIGSVSLKTVPVTHTVPTIGVRLESAGKSVTFSSDTIYDERLVALARGSDLLVHEAFTTSKLAGIAAQAMHATADEAGRAALDSGSKRLALCHTTPMDWAAPDAVIREARAHFAGPIDLPADLERIDF